VVEGLTEFLELFGGDVTRFRGGKDLALKEGDLLVVSLDKLTIFKVQIIMSVFRVLVIFDVGVDSALLSLLNGRQTALESLQLLALSLEERELFFKRSRVVGQGSTKSSQFVVERIGNVGEVTSESVKDGTNVVVEVGSTSDFGNREFLEVVCNILRRKSTGWSVGGTVEGLLFGLNVTKEGNELCLFGNPSTTFVLLVVTESLDLGLGALVIVTQRVIAQGRGLGGDRSVESASTTFVFFNELVKTLVEPNKFGDATTGGFDFVEGRKDFVKLGNVCHDGSLVWSRHVDNIFGVEKTRNIKVLESDIEGQVQVAKLVLGSQAVVINEIWAMTMDQSTESQSVLEGHSEVLDVNVVIGLSLSSAP
jgi:hypothetical protein